MASARPTIVWFRQDLRLSDNPALSAAIKRGQPVLTLYILDDDARPAWRLGGASRWWLHHSLHALGRDLAAHGGALVLRRGAASQVLARLIRETGATAVFWNRCYEPFAISRDTELKRSLSEGGLAVRSFNASLLHEPTALKTKAGQPYKVFTPFWNALRTTVPDRPQPGPETIRGLEVASDQLESWGLLPKQPDWAEGWRASWTPGEAGAQARLRAFLRDALEGYGSARDLADRPGTSRLSPHLRWGEIGPRQVWHVTLDRHRAAEAPQDDATAFLRELAWREFSAHLLYHWPSLPERAWRETFAAFPWRSDDAGYEAWCRGLTGYPFVDAGMRELWTTGWMHNRVRMVTASFLVKHLLVPWQRGEAWFWDTLVDADLANNAASWQWVAGSGADAAPYFRIFNPVSQGEKFDRDGVYVRRYVPEIAGLPDRYLHRPWSAPCAVLRAAGVRLGVTYPEPIVDHASARARALRAYQDLKNT